jgi:hypothetical protein
VGWSVIHHIYGQLQRFSPALYINLLNEGVSNKKYHKAIAKTREMNSAGMNSWWQNANKIRYIKKYPNQLDPSLLKQTHSDPIWHMFWRIFSNLLWTQNWPITPLKRVYSQMNKRWVGWYSSCDTVSVQCGLVQRWSQSGNQIFVITLCPGGQYYCDYLSLRIPLSVSENRQHSKVSAGGRRQTLTARGRWRQPSGGGGVVDSIRSSVKLLLQHILVKTIIAKYIIVNICKMIFITTLTASQRVSDCESFSKLIFNFGADVVSHNPAASHCITLHCIALHRNSGAAEDHPVIFPLTNLAKTKWLIFIWETVSLLSYGPIS